MKSFAFTLIALIGLVLLMATTPPPDKYQYGKRSSVTLTAEDDTMVTIEPNNLTFTYATLAIDTNVTVVADVDNSIVGDRILLHVTADASNRLIDWSTNITAINDSVVATKTKLFEFVYNGTGFYQVAESGVD